MRPAQLLLAIAVCLCAVLVGQALAGQDGAGGDMASARSAEQPQGVPDDMTQTLFDASIRSILPLGPEDLERYRGRKSDLEKAATAEPAAMVTETRPLSVQPGTKPPIVRTTPGYVSSIVFQDATGAPWPITETIGGSKLFSVVRSESEPFNLLTIEPLSNHGNSNLSVKLDGLDVPVIIQLLTQSATSKGRVSEALVTFQLDARGPNAVTPVIGRANTETVDKVILDILDGIPPADARRIAMNPSVPDLSVWEHDGNIYMRSRYPAIWPSWTRTVTRSSWSVYEMKPVNSVVLSRDGEQMTIDLDLEGRD